MLAKSLSFYRANQLINLSFKKLATKNRSIVVPTLNQCRYFSQKVSKDKLIVFDTTLRDGEQVVIFFVKNYNYQKNNDNSY